MASNKKTLLDLAAVVVSTAVLGTTLIVASGSGDPRPQDAPVWREVPGSITVAPASSSAVWLSESAPLNVGQIVLQARHLGGELDSGYGITLEGEGASFVVAVSPLGYVALWQQAEGPLLHANSDSMPWQPWPHVHQGVQPNRIMVTTDGIQHEIRINDEVFWRGDISVELRRVGIFGVSYGAETTIDFLAVELYEK